MPWTVLVLIAAMFAVSLGIKNSGAAEQMAHAVGARFDDSGMRRWMTAVARPGDSQR
jgi:di/tricarboxylate transporter